MCSLDTPTDMNITFSGGGLDPFYAPAVNMTVPYSSYLAYNTGGVVSEDNGTLESNFPTRAVRTSINLPFNKETRYTKSCEYWPNNTCKVDTITYTPFSLDTYISTGSVTGSLENFYTHEDEVFYIYKNNIYHNEGSILSLYVDASGATDVKRMSENLKARNIDLLQVFFGGPHDYMVECNGRDISDCAEINPARMREFALYKAIQLVYQAKHGVSPEFIELFNEPEGGW